MTQPPPPPAVPGDRTILGRRVAVGMGLAFLAHLVSIGVIIGAIQLGSQIAVLLVIALVVEILVFAGCLAFGILGIRRGDRGRGLGLLIGWAVGIIVLPVIGFGVCVAALAAQ